MTRDDSTTPATSRPRARRIPRAALTLAATALAATSLTACNKMSPQQTDHSYAPADGVDLSLGQVQVRDLLLVSPAQGQSGRLVGEVVNQGQQDADVQFALPGGGTPVTAKVKAGDAVVLADQDLTLSSVPAAPGAMTNLVVSTGESGQQNPSVPVLAPLAGSPYSTLTPSATPSTTTASPSSTGMPTMTPMAGQSGAAAAPSSSAAAPSTPGATPTH